MVRDPVIAPVLSSVLAGLAHLPRAEALQRGLAPNKLLAKAVAQASAAAERTSQEQIKRLQQEHQAIIQEVLWGWD